MSQKSLKVSPQVVAAEQKSYHHGDLKTALIEAGLRFLAHRPLREISMRTLAAEVGVSHTAAKYHFGGMQGFYTALATIGHQRLTAEMSEGRGAGSSRKAELTRASEGYVRFAIKHPELFRLMFATDYYDRTDHDLKVAAQGSMDVLQGVARGLRWDKSAWPDGPARTEAMLWSFVHGYAMLLIDREISLAADGSPPFDVQGVMPDFDYVDDPAPT